MDSWEAPWGRLEVVWRRFGTSLGAFEAFSGVVLDPKSNHVQFSIEERTRSVVPLEETHEAFRLRLKLRRRPLPTQ